MRVLGALRLFFHKGLWTVTGHRAAGRALVDALSSPDPSIRELAGMFLAQGGSRAQPLLEEAMNRRQNLPLVLAVAGDIADRRLEAALVRFSEDGDPNVARAARDALRVFHLRHHSRSDSAPS